MNDTNQFPRFFGNLRNISGVDVTVHEVWPRLVDYGYGWLTTKFC